MGDADGAGIIGYLDYYGESSGVYELNYGDEGTIFQYTSDIFYLDDEILVFTAYKDHEDEGPTGFINPVSYVLD